MTNPRNHFNPLGAARRRDAGEGSRRAGLAGLLLLAMAACSGDRGGGASPTSAPAPTTAPTTTIVSTTLNTGQVLNTSSPPTTTQPAGNPIGTEIRTALGNTVTAYAYQAVPTDRTSPTPAAGTTYAAVDVGGCVATGNEGPDPQYFELVMPDASRLRPAVAVKQPPLRETRLAAGECIRGWITYEIPTAARPVALVYNASSLIRWTIT